MGWQGGPLMGDGGVEWVVREGCWNPEIGERFPMLTGWRVVLGAVAG